tara:strand:- start:181 stop:381 length:201 start_codon:yes stop_codon:yes gene_type:complete
MKNLFVLANASLIYKQVEKANHGGKLTENELKSLLFKALWLLEATEAERNKLESKIKWGKEEERFF